MDIIRRGDFTDHGGKAITAAETADYDGIPLAHKGDLIKCPLHPEAQPNLIVEGDDPLDGEGRPLARRGHKGTCGCRLISSITHSAGLQLRLAAGVHHTAAVRHPGVADWIQFYSHRLPASR